MRLHFVLAQHFSSQSTFIMDSQFKLFSLNRKLYKSMGLLASPSSPSCRSKILNIFLFISTVLLFITTSAYFLFEANTADDRGVTFFISMANLFTMINIVSTALQIDKILLLINNYEQFITKSSLCTQKS